MRDKKSLGYFISGRRKVMGLTQEELGNKIGVSKSAIAKWETNGGLPDRNNLKKLSEIMILYHHSAKTMMATSRILVKRQERHITKLLIQR